MYFPMLYKPRRRVFTPAGFVWDDEFTTALAAGSVNGTAAEPGPGTRSVSDANSVISISGGQLVINGSLAQQNGYITTLLTRTAGRLFVYNVPVQTTLGAVRYGVSTVALTASTLTLGVDYSGGVMRINDPNSAVIAPDATGILGFGIAMFNTGNGLWVSISGVWTLEWILDTGTAAEFWKIMGAAGSASTINVAVEFLRIRDMGTLLNASDFATVNVASPSNLSVQTATADQLVELAITAPGTLANTCGVRYNVLDGSNYNIAYFDSAGAFKLDTVVSGSPTNRINVAGVITTSATRTIRVVHSSGSVHDAYTLNGSTWTKRGAQIVNSNQGTQTGIAADIGATWTAANLRSYPRTATAYNVFNQV